MRKNTNKRRGRGTRSNRFPVLQSIPTSSITRTFNFTPTSTSATATLYAIDANSLGLSEGSVFRVSSVDVEAAINQTSAVAGKIQVIIASDDGGIPRAISRAMVIPASPLRFKLRNPRNNSWTTVGPTVVGIANVLVTGSASVEVMIHFAVRECPQLTTT